jgi:hypothetical protein
MQRLVAIDSVAENFFFFLGIVWSNTYEEKKNYLFKNIKKINLK